MPVLSSVGRAIARSLREPRVFFLDPFLGSGTLLFEAGRVGLAAFGSEINPAAFKIAITYRLINFSLARRRQLVDLVADRLGESCLDSAPLFAVRGFSLCSRQERVFQNRFGELIYEDSCTLALARSAQGR